MKVGVITFWWCHENYGQILQCFALQEYLRIQGHSPFLIKYRADSLFGKPSKKALLIRLVKEPASFFLSVKYRLDGTAAERSVRKKKLIINRNFESFKKKYIESTEHVYRTYSEISDGDFNADAYIVGSDLVWKNFPSNDDGKVMFLDFGQACSGAKRIAYSASFGRASVDQKFLEFVAPLLKRFDGIGVREASGVSICKQMGRSDAVHVLDPTLLLKRDDYLGAFSSEVEDVQGYEDSVFAYFLQAKVDIPWGEIKSFCQNKQLELKLTTVYSNKGFPVGLFFDPTIPEWVYIMSTAKAVITNSFHGTAFAIVMQRPFLAFLRTENKGMNDRIISLLTALGLESRIYNKNNGAFCDQLNVAVDWESVNMRLSSLREKSIVFLNRFLM
ncbi:MAG: polysaccharide pyruvyl transferase family protein [Bacteroidales bacterium]|nr:polysaccharide pyruvyl transferase family protein [Kiritimatiellia bacterium]MDD3892698.1 polysaccharide pyruvyl transferase family protein [Bacteroidales bacterium]